MASADDHRLMTACLALARRGAGRTGTNPNVGCLIARDGRIIGRGWTADGGRPHAEAVALANAGESAAGATAYVTLEPCAHDSLRGPCCADILVKAGIDRCVVAMADPDPRTAGKGIARLEAAGITVDLGVSGHEAECELAGFAGHLRYGRPELTLKLALSLDGRLAMADGRSQWITGGQAQAFGHRLRARSDLVVVGGGTLRADRPQLTVRIAGYIGPQPARAAITSGQVPDGWITIPGIDALDTMACARGFNRILCEGGGQLAAALLAADRVDRLVILRAPILIGAGHGLEALNTPDLAACHDRWVLEDRRPLGPDLLESYTRAHGRRVDA